MASPISEESSDLPSPMRKPKTLDAYDSDNSDEVTPEESQQFYDEWNKSQGFEIDFSKLTFWSNWQPLDLEDTTPCDDGETNRELVTRLANAAVTKRNAEKGTSLELGEVLRANFYPSGGLTFHISFEVSDPSESDGNKTKPYRAVVRDLCEEAIVYSCDPKPSA